MAGKSTPPARRPMPAQAKNIGKGKPAMSGLARPLPAQAAAKATQMRGVGKRK